MRGKLEALVHSMALWSAFNEARALCAGSWAGVGGRGEAAAVLQ